MREAYVFIRAVWRLVLFAVLISFYLATSAWVYFTNKNLVRRRRRLINNCSLYCRIILKAFSIELICKDPIEESEASLLVGNHVGFIDILCLQAVHPSVFITSVEMRETPVLGQISEMGGCAYVDRRNRMKIQDELQDIVQVLKDGFPIVLYAESVASNGEQVLPFKKTLMMAAGLANRPIRPFCFNFRKANNGPILYSQRDSLCWYGDQSFFPSIWRSFQLDSVTCEINFLPLVHSSPEIDRTHLANQVHNLVQEKFSPFKTEMNLN